MYHVEVSIGDGSWERDGTYRTLRDAMESRLEIERIGLAARIIRTVDSTLKELAK